MPTQAKRQQCSDFEQPSGKISKRKSLLKNQFPFDCQQARVLLFRECESSSDRRLLFDSNCLQKVYHGSSQIANNHNSTINHNGNHHHNSNNTSNGIGMGVSRGKDYNNQNGGHNGKNIQQQQQPQNNGVKGHSNDFIEVCKEYGYKHNRPASSSDISGIGEMVFGASATSYRGTAFKIHWLQSPARILFSQVFLAPLSNSSSSTSSCSGVNGGGGGGSGHSPYSSISLLNTPRTSISSEAGSISGFSMSSLSANVAPWRHISRKLSLTPSGPLDVPPAVAPPINMAMAACGGGVGAGGGGGGGDQHSLGAQSDTSGCWPPRHSSAYSTMTTTTDSGIGGGGGSGGRSGRDQWSSTASYVYSTRSSIGSSVLSEQSDEQRKLSLDSAYGGLSCNGLSAPLLHAFASDGGLQRRICRHLRTSFENENAISDLIGFVGDAHAMGGGCGSGGGGSDGGILGPTTTPYRRSSYCTNETRSNPEMGYSSRRRPAHRRARLGLAVCITLSESYEDEMELFCSEHAALLEAMLSRLRACSEQAYVQHSSFLAFLYQAWRDVQRWCGDLFTAPRIKVPVWLSITTSGSKHSKNVAERFVKDLCGLLAIADTKDTNFFVSTTLTAILTHHLGWVSTVSAYHAHSSASAADAAANVHADATASAACEQRARLLQVSQKHPYNALWAQLGDLFGAVGQPLKLARTIVYGTEKPGVERLLSVLTYFIRCAEVRRAAKREDFNRAAISSLVLSKRNERVRRTGVVTSPSVTASGDIMTSIECGATERSNGNGSTGGGGMRRTQTCKQNLSTIAGKQSDNENDDGVGVGDDDVDGDGNYLSSATACDSDDGRGTESPLDTDGDADATDAACAPTQKRNEIPNVFAFRDSRFVRQELRIGNYLMDTGIEREKMQKQQQQQQQPIQSMSNRAQQQNAGTIRLTVTTPENVVLPVAGDEEDSDSGAVEAIEMDIGVGGGTTAIDSITTPLRKTTAGRFLWQPSPVREGLSLAEADRLQHGEGEGAGNLLMRRYQHQQQQQHHHPPSLSDLITQNSMGRGERMTWGIEPIKETISREEQLHFDSSRRQIERTHGLHGGEQQQQQQQQQVVFVLGDNEPLVNLRSRSTEELCRRLMGDHDEIISTTNTIMMTDCMERRDSGVALPRIQSTASLETLKSTTTTLEKGETMNSNGQMAITPITCNSSSSSSSSPSPASRIRANGGGGGVRPTTYCSNGKRGKVSSQRGSISSVAAKCAAALNDINSGGGGVSGGMLTVLNLQELPLSATKESTLSSDDSGSSSGSGGTSGSVGGGIGSVSGGDVMKLRTGFVPSLLLGVSDHYIADAVLQGITSSSSATNSKTLPSEGLRLREDLVLAARSATLISQPAENVAIIADMERWEVRLISSRAQSMGLLCGGGQSAPIGMSRLVADMLEAVQCMNANGIAAYECLSFLEAKLEEIYLHSETLAAFLLETDFCSLHTCSSALNLAENDVPLLLAIATIHTPIIAKKCGISFR